MVFTFLGTGSAFCLKNFQSNVVINKKGKNLLFDAGTDLRFALAEAGLSLNVIDAVYVSHLHSDHIGGLEYIAFKTAFTPSFHKLTLYAHKQVALDLWCQSLRGGLNSIEGQSMNLKDYFNVFELQKDNKFTWNEIECELIHSMHIHNGIYNLAVFGLLMYDTQFKQKVYITSDTKFSPEYLAQYYNEADVIIHDCETSELKTGIHAHYDDLCSLDEDIKRKMYLWHYNDQVVSNFEKWSSRAQKDKFAGFVRRGQELMVERRIGLV